MVEWRDLSSTQRALGGVAASVQVAMAVAAWTDLAVRAADEVNGRKVTWALVIAVNFVGPLAYYRWGRRRTTGS